MTENNDALNWDSPIEKGDEFVILPEGLADFEVLKLDRARKEMGKLGTCNVGVLKLLLTSRGDGSSATKDVNLPLHRKVQFKLYQFFTSIGQRKHGEDGPFVPNWGKVAGATGVCEIEHRKWIGKDGKERTDYDVKKFMAADDVPSDTKGDDIPF